MPCLEKPDVHPLGGLVQAYLADLCLRRVTHVLKELLCPVYEGLHVQAVIWQGPPAALAVAAKAALQPLNKPATIAIPAYCGSKVKR